MSDCSTQVMMPKEPPRTCGGCSERYLAPKCNRLGWVDFEENDTPDDDGYTRADFCPYWKQTETDVLEQRCQHLEKVAREMYSALIYCSNGCSEGCPMLDDGCIVSSGELRSRLEALGGVNLDGSCRHWEVCAYV